MKLLRSESYKKGIAYSIGLNVFAKGLAFMNSIAIAFFFGAQSRTDIYFYCYATIGLLVGFIGALDGSVIIPEAMRIREQSGEGKERPFLNFFLYLYSGVGLLIVLVLLVDPVKALGAISNFGKVSLASDHDLIASFIPIALLMLVTTYLTNILSAYKYFTLPIIAGIINNFFSLIFLILFHKTLDVKSLIFGIATGYTINIVMLVYIMKSQLAWKFKFRRISFDRKLKKNIGYALLGNITSFFSGYAPFFIMSSFSPGIVTIFNYARNLAEMPNQMITTQFSNVAGIKFNELTAKNIKVELNRFFIQSTGFLLFIMTPVCAILFLFSEELVTLLYKRGAFDHETVKQTAMLLKFLSFTVIYFVINTMVSRLFMATQKLKESFWYQMLMNILFISFIGAGAYRFGIYGYVAGTILYQALVIIFTYWLMKKHFPYIGYSKVLEILGINILLNLCLVIVFSFLVSREQSSVVPTMLAIGLYLGLILAVNQGFIINRSCRDFCRQAFRRIGGITLLKPKV